MLQYVVVVVMQQIFTTNKIYVTISTD